jgi:excisionase family DNA binding protein
LSENNTSSEDSRRLLSIGQLSQQLGVSVKTLYGWVCLRQIPYLKMGRLVKFDTRDIEKWIETKKSRCLAVQ